MRCVDLRKSSERLLYVHIYTYVKGLYMGVCVCVYIYIFVPWPERHRWLSTQQIKLSNVQQEWTSLHLSVALRVFSTFIWESKGENAVWSSLCHHFITEPSAAALHFAFWPCPIHQHPAVIVWTVQVTSKKLRSYRIFSIFFFPLKKQNKTFFSSAGIDSISLCCVVLDVHMMQLHPQHRIYL